MIWLKNYSSQQKNVFNKKIDTFDVLTLIQIRAVSKITTKFLTH